MNSNSVNSTRLYSSGVISFEEDYVPRQKDTKLIVSKADKEVNQLYNELVTLQSSTDSFEFRKRIIKCAMRLIKKPYPWFHTQLCYNEHLHGTNLELIEDTLRFILTGKRRVHISVWENIITRYPDTIEGKKCLNDYSIMELLEATRTQSVNALWIKWISRKNGINDMLRTMYILFGGSDISSND